MRYAPSTKILPLARIAAVSCFAVHAPAALAANPTSYFEYSTIGGIGQTMQVSRLPTTDSSGGVHYYDVTIGFTINADGSVGTTPSVIATPSLMPITANFVAGTYTLPGTAADGTVQVSGPGVGKRGSTVWTLSAANPDSKSPLTEGSWTVGPLSDNPQAAAYMRKHNINADPNEYYGFAQWGANSDILLIGMSAVQGGATMSGRVWDGDFEVETLAYTRTSP